MPASSTWGLGEVRSDRLAGDVLPQPDRQRGPVGRRILEDVPETDEATLAVGNLDADRLLAGDRSKDANIGRGEGVGEVVLELGYLGDLRAGGEPQLVARDVRPATVPITRACTPKWPSASTRPAATRSWPAVSGRLCSALERVSRRLAWGSRQTKSGIRGHLLAQAPAWSQELRVARPRPGGTRARVARAGPLGLLPRAAGFAGLAVEVPGVGGLLGGRAGAPALRVPGRRGLFPATVPLPGSPSGSRGAGSSWFQIRGSSASSAGASTCVARMISSSGLGSGGSTALRRWARGLTRSAVAARGADGGGRACGSCRRGRCRSPAGRPRAKLPSTARGLPRTGRPR